MFPLWWSWHTTDSHHFTRGTRHLSLHIFSFGPQKSTTLSNTTEMWIIFLPTVLDVPVNEWEGTRSSRVTPSNCSAPRGWSAEQNHGKGIHDICRGRRGHCPKSKYFYVEQFCSPWKFVRALWRKLALHEKQFCSIWNFCLSLPHMTQQNMNKVRVDDQSNQWWQLH